MAGNGKSCNYFALPLVFPAEELHYLHRSEQIMSVQPIGGPATPALQTTQQAGKGKGHHHRRTAAAGTSQSQQANAAQTTQDLLAPAGTTASATQTATGTPASASLIDTTA